MAEMAEIFPLFRYFSVSSVMDKDNSQSDWRKDFYNGRNGIKRKINGKVFVYWEFMLIFAASNVKMYGRKTLSSD